ncbi:hypothetical protein BDV95DRAFT_572530 [Massariosphaeria phaeospora]|uniref:Uncharacterized protein n=1 Tax=Massariosphaeria phaeospora TaxID=100035 RepID=A0A7C8M873_9PLEO|nr:hypothetical protein BDV95DRAFT_572530 [Massariosphaeria phaeospora]
MFQCFRWKKARFRFLDLPPELRDRVYHFVRESYATPSSEHRIYAKNKHIAALAYTCKQVYHEYWPIGLQAMQIHVNIKGLPRLIASLRCLSPKLEVFPRKIVVRLDKPATVIAKARFLDSIDILPLIRFQHLSNYQQSEIEFVVSSSDSRRRKRLQWEECQSLNRFVKGDHWNRVLEDPSLQRVDLVRSLEFECSMVQVMFMSDTTVCFVQKYSQCTLKEWLELTEQTMEKLGLPVIPTQRAGITVLIHVPRD